MAIYFPGAETWIGFLRAGKPCQLKYVNVTDDDAVSVEDNTLHDKDPVLTKDMSGFIVSWTINEVSTKEHLLAGLVIVRI